MESKQYKFKRSCIFRSGKFEGFYGWRSIFGHLIVIGGLIYGARTTYLHVLKPAGNYIAPSIINFYEGMFKV